MWSPNDRSLRIEVDDKSRVVNVLPVPTPIIIMLILVLYWCLVLGGAYIV